MRYIQLENADGRCYTYDMELDTYVNGTSKNVDVTLYNVDLIESKYIKQFATEKEKDAVFIFSLFQLSDKYFVAMDEKYQLFIAECADYDFEEPKIDELRFIGLYERDGFYSFDTLLFCTFDYDCNSDELMDRLKSLSQQTYDVENLTSIGTAHLDAKYYRDYDIIKSINDELLLMADFKNGELKIGEKRIYKVNYTEGNLIKLNTL